MAPLGGTTGHKWMSNREARSWTEGIITEQRSQAAFNKYHDEPLPPSALPPRHKAAAAASGANQRGSSSGVVAPAIDMDNAHQDHGIETMEATRQNRRMPAHMRGEADEAIYGRDLDGSTWEDAREAHIKPELWTGPRIPLRKTLPVTHHQHKTTHETVLRKKAVSSAEVRMRALQGDGLHKRPHRSLQEPALKPGQITHNTSDNFHAAPFMSKNRAVEQWTTYRNAINPMLQLSPGDPRLPEHARQCFSNTMLTHSSLNSVAGRSTMQTMQRLTTASLRSPIASRSPEPSEARPHTSSSAQLRLPADAASSASSGPSPVAPRQMMRTPTMAATAMTQTIQPAIPHSRSTPNFGTPSSVGGGAFGSGSSLGSTRGLHNTLAAAQSLAAVEVADMFTRMANAETLRPLTAATTIKRERGRIDAQPGMIWNQTYSAQKNGDAPGWRVLTPAENVARRSGVLTRAGL